jgi:hypothetical protein
MYRLAEMFTLTKIDWQFFGTLTFREPFLRKRETGFAQQRRLSLFNEFGRDISRSLYFSRKNWVHVKHCLRLEQGEIGGQWHFHFLMSGFRKGSVNIGTAKFMESTWLHDCQGGFCKIRVFDSRQNGVEYISKILDPADKYEFNKFGLASALTFSPACIRVIGNLGKATVRECSVLQMRVGGREPALKKAGENITTRLVGPVAVKENQHGSFLYLTTDKSSGVKVSDGLSEERGLPGTGGNTLPTKTAQCIGGVVATDLPCPVWGAFETL